MENLADAAKVTSQRRASDRVPEAGRLAEKATPLLQFRQRIREAKVIEGLRLAAIGASDCRPDNRSPKP